MKCWLKQEKSIISVSSIIVVHQVQELESTDMGGDPNDSETGVLNLFISDFHQTTEIGRLTKTQMDVIFKRLLKFLNSALDTDWRSSLEESSRAFGLADLISHRWDDIIAIFVFS